MSKCLCHGKDILLVTHDYRIRKHFHVSFLWSIKSILRHKDKSNICGDKQNQYEILLKEKFSLFLNLSFSGDMSVLSQ